MKTVANDKPVMSAENLPPVLEAKRKAEIKRRLIEMRANCPRCVKETICKEHNPTAIDMIVNPENYVTEAELAAL